MLLTAVPRSPAEGTVNCNYRPIVRILYCLCESSLIFFKDFTSFPTHLGVVWAHLLVKLVECTEELDVVVTARAVSEKQTEQRSFA